MRYRHHVLLWFLFLICTRVASFSQSFNHPVDSVVSGSSCREVFTIPDADTLLQLQHRFVIEGSERISINGELLQRGTEYLLDASRGTIRIFPSVDSVRFPQRGSRREVLVRYIAIALDVPAKVQHRIPVLRIDSTSRDSEYVPVPEGRFTPDDLFGSKLKKSGSIVRGLTVGTNRDFSLNSGLRLQMSGSLADNVDIVAALTDENTPLQPEGTTQTLQEIDKVFVELRGTDVRATLGDFSFSTGGGTFGSLTRKVQGAKGEARYVTGQVRGDLQLAGATTRGKYASMQFPGIDGVQGPYRLRGNNNERDIIVIAGTERVYVNGERMTRGEANDYTIDYGIAEVTFMSGRLVSQSSRITVDFEYSDRQFNRTMLAGTSTFRTADDGLVLTASMFRERDDRESPIDVILTEADREVLRGAGSDRSRAVRSGAERVGPGKGQYKDSTVVLGDSTMMTVFRYAPWDTLNAVYAVTFSDVGQGRGDYSRLSIGQFEYAGRGRGAFLPVRYLPMPQSHSLGDFTLRYSPAVDISVDADVALSRFDANTFSARDDENNSGVGARFGMALQPQKISLFGTSLGSFGLTLNERYRSERFVPPDRVDDVEFDRTWGTTIRGQESEELHEGTITYSPLSEIRVGTSLGSMSRGESFTSNRYSASFLLADSSLPVVSYLLDNLRTEDLAGKTDGSWMRHAGDVSYRRGSIHPGIRIESESRSLRISAGDSLRDGSFRFTEILPRINIADVAGMTMNIEAGFRNEDSVINGNFSRASGGTLTRWEWSLREWNSLSSSLTLSSRTRTFTEEFRRRGNQDNTTLLVRSQTRYAPLQRAIDIDLFYEVASERSARLERVFQSVPRGTGNYVYAGDLNGNMVRDEEDFRPVRFDGDYIALLLPSDQLVPVTGVKGSTRIRASGKRLVGRAEWWERVIASLSTETYARVEEKSTEEDSWRIYSLDFSRFLNDRTTMTGSNLFTQDVHLFELNPDFSIRMRYSSRHGLTQFARQRERSFVRERSSRVRWQPLQEIGLEVEATLRDDNLQSEPSGYRERRVSTTTVVTDWSYRPEQSLEIGFTIGTGNATNYDTTRAYLNQEGVRAVYSLEERGQIRIDLNREESVLSHHGSSIPYELTGGRFAGIAWLWKCSVEYRIAGFLQVTINYDGRSEGGNPPVHSARAEVRAFF